MPHRVVASLFCASVHHDYRVILSIHSSFLRHSSSRVRSSRYVKLLAHALVLPTLSLTSFLTWSSKSSGYLLILVGRIGSWR
jgi:hypothetical protein